MEEPDWILESAGGGELFYLNEDFSEEFALQILDSGEEGIYLCLYDQQTEECIRVYGTRGEFVLEGDLLTKADEFLHFVLARLNGSTQKVLKQGFDELEIELEVEERELFNAEEAVRFMKEFHDSKQVEQVGVELVPKRYLW